MERCIKYSGKVKFQDGEEGFDIVQKQKNKRKNHKNKNRINWEHYKNNSVYLTKGEYSLSLINQIRLNLDFRDGISIRGIFVYKEQYSNSNKIDTDRDGVWDNGETDFENSDTDEKLGNL